MSDITTLAKIAALPKIMEAARTLYLYGLSKEEPTAAVKRYLSANQDVKRYVEKAMNENMEKLAAQGMKP